MKLLFLAGTNYNFRGHRLRCCNAPARIGVMESWSNGVLGRRVRTHHSNIPLLHHSVSSPSSDDRLERFADRFAAGLAVSHLHVAAHDREHRHAFDFPTM